METIDESEEATTSSEELNQLIQQLQQELTMEDKRHFDTLAYFKNREKEEEERHSKQHQLLEARLLQAIAQAEDSIADSLGRISLGRGRGIPLFLQEHRNS